MKKMILCFVLALVLVASSALGATFKRNDDGTIVTIDNEKFVLVNLLRGRTRAGDIISIAVYTKEDNTKGLTVYSHRPSSRPFVFVIVKLDANQMPSHILAAVEDFNCDNEWQVFDARGVEISLPDCAVSE